jgi:hypothetical protein
MSFPVPKMAKAAASAKGAALNFHVENEISDENNAPAPMHAS